MFHDKRNGTEENIRILLMARNGTRNLMTLLISNFCPLDDYFELILA